MTEHDIECEQALRQLFAYIDRELGAAEHAAMERHLHTCQSCFSRAEFERRLKAKLRELRDDEPDTKVRDRVKSLLESF